MLRRLCEYVKINDLVRKNDRVLLAVSGGIDSVALAELFHQAGIRFAIAHCNFGLRGEESDEDQRFVEGLSKKYRVPFHTKVFLTAEDAKERGVSIQMAARDLRYKWFGEVREAEGYDSIATGHHLDDQAETFFINLLRGTGISGLHGILPRNGKLIRPLLFATRDEIGDFVRYSHLSYRDDSSNSSKKYLRNRIRQELIPLLKEINPDIVPVLSGNIDRIREAVEIYRQKIEEVRKRIMIKKERKILVPVAELKSLKPGRTWMFELFSPYGFNESVTADMASALHNPGRKEFISEQFMVVRDREQFIITRRARKRSEEHEAEYVIRKGQSTVKKPVFLAIREIPDARGVTIPPEREFASLDMEKLEFPLVLKRWKPGDAFIPFGMQQKKKISDYFIDAKVSSEEKESAWVLWSGQKIAWVVGHRPDNRFRVTSRTRSILQICYLCR
jgi:tRNA(Ile)-lysidine synthase